MLPLLGIKVVELSKNIAGFYGGMILADLGAEVIKVEKTESDPARDAGPFWKGAIFAAFNRNKKSLSVDLEKIEGKEILKKLLENSEILFEDLDRNVLENLGFSYSEVSKLNPMIAYTSIKDCLDGPYQDRPWTDGSLEAEAGMMCTTGLPDPEQPLVSERPPVRFGVPVASTTAGIYAAMWAMGTLLTKKVTGNGEYIQVGRLESAVSIIQQWVIDFSAGKFYEKHAARNYKTKDGMWAYYNIVSSDEYWGIFCKTFGVSGEDTKATEKLKDRSSGGTAGFTDKVNKILEEKTAAYTRAEIWKKLIDLRIPGGAVNSIKEIVDEDMHLKETKFLVPIEASPEVAKTSEPKTFLNPMLPLDSVDYNHEIVKNWTPPPKLGEHTVEILRGLNYNENDIADLKNKKVVWPY